MARIRWAGHLQRMTEETIPERVFQGRAGRRGPKGRRKKKWLDSLKEDLRRLGFRRGL